MHPLYNTSELTDDELSEKIGQAQLYMSQQERLGHTPTVSSIKQTIMQLQDEMAARLGTTIRDGLTKGTPDYLEPIELGTIDTTEWDKRYEDR